jgi:hypothetical protein
MEMKRKEDETIFSHKCHWAVFDGNNPNVVIVSASIGRQEKALQ